MLGHQEGILCGDVVVTVCLPQVLALTNCWEKKQSDRRSSVNWPWELLNVTGTHDCASDPGMSDSEFC